MYFLHLLAFIILLFLYESHSLPEGFCDWTNSNQILRICTENRMINTTTVYIDTLEAPKVKNTSCECHISPSRKSAYLVFSMINITQQSQLKFEIKGKVLNKMHSSHELRIRENTELKFISHSAQAQQGACLTIYPKNRDDTFSIHCTNVVTTTTTTTEKMPVSNSTSQMTQTMSSLSSISKSHTLSTKKQKSTKVGHENTADNGSSGSKVPIVAACIATFICLAGFVILFVIICRRHRSVKGKRNNQSNEVAVSVLEPNTGQSECDTNTYEIPDQNVYEGLDRQDNAPSDETYQHLYTETQNVGCDIKTQNLSHRQSDTSSLEEEHTNTPDSICDSIHRENSSNEYESYKTNATDHMYETLQKDK